MCYISLKFVLLFKFFDFLVYSDEFEDDDDVPLPRAAFATSDESDRSFFSSSSLSSTSNTGSNPQIRYRPKIGLLKKAIAKLSPKITPETSINEIIKIVAHVFTVILEISTNHVSIFFWKILKFYVKLRNFLVFLFVIL